MLETVAWERQGDDKIDIGYVRGPELRHVGNRITIQVMGFSYDGAEYEDDPKKVAMMLSRIGCGAEFDAATMTYTDYEYNWETVC